MHIDPETNGMSIIQYGWYRLYIKPCSDPIFREQAIINCEARIGEHSEKNARTLVDEVAQVEKKMHTSEVPVLTANVNEITKKRRKGRKIERESNAIAAADKRMRAEENSKEQCEQILNPTQKANKQKKNQRKCGNCGKLGHNRLTCKDAIAPVDQLGLQYDDKEDKNDDDAIQTEDEIDYISEEDHDSNDSNEDF